MYGQRQSKSYSTHASILLANRQQFSAGTNQLLSECVYKKELIENDVHSTLPWVSRYSLNFYFILLCLFYFVNEKILIHTPPHIVLLFLYSTISYAFIVYYTVGTTGPYITFLVWHYDIRWVSPYKKNACTYILHKIIN